MNAHKDQDRPSAVPSTTSLLRGWWTNAVRNADGRAASRDKAPSRSDGTLESHTSGESGSKTTRWRTFGGVAAPAWMALAAILAVLIAVAAAAVVGVNQQTLYEAEALAVASELEIRVESFPGTVTAIFEGGPVAEITAANAGTGIDPDDLIPEIITVSPIENTGVVAINALHPDPELAQRYANAAADALVEELNRIGPGLGVFVVHSAARLPDGPVPEPFLQRALIGILVAVVFVVGLLALLAVISTWRRGRSGAANAVRGDRTSVVNGIGPVFEERLDTLGIHSLTDLTDADPEWLASVMDVHPKMTAGWVAQAESLVREHAGPPDSRMSETDDVSGH
jgi:capsular polysaccharide biosynthesis protein